MRFAGKTAVVTGAASGIGKATCLRLAEEGATTAVKRFVLKVHGNRVAALSLRRAGTQTPPAAQAPPP